MMPKRKKSTTPEINAAMRNLVHARSALRFAQQVFGEAEEAVALACANAGWPRDSNYDVEWDSTTRIAKVTSTEAPPAPDAT